MSATASAAGSTRPRKPRTAWKTWLALAGVALITWWASSERYGIDVEVLGFWESLSNGTNKLAELAQPRFKYFDETVTPMLETLEMAVVGTAVGCVVCLPLAFLASRVTTPALWLRGPVRAVMSVIRAIPELLYAVVLVSMIGVGALSGIVSIILFSIGILVKLLAEVIDAVDTGPYEAAEAAGGNRIASARTAVLPQVLPSFTSFALYVFELNIRTSAVLGLVSAGGIGQLLNTWRKFYRYNDVSLIVLEILVIVFALEIISALIRRRLA